MQQRTYSEAQMADRFLHVLRSKAGIPGLGQFTSVFREVDCLRGRADFLAVATPHDASIVRITSHLGLTDSAVLAQLKYGSPRTTSYLTNTTGFSTRSIRSSLEKMRSLNMIKRAGDDSYLIANLNSLFKARLWAFELKIANMKRAVFQAQQYRALAGTVMIVVPPEKSQVVARFSPALRIWGIGVATFDYFSREVRIVRLPASGRPVSRQHHLYAVAQLLKRAS